MLLIISYTVHLYLQKQIKAQVDLEMLAVSNLGCKIQLFVLNISIIYKSD